MVALLFLAGCPTSSTSSTWQSSCGDPACRDSGWVDKGVDACTSEVEGDTCAEDGAACDPHDPCNVTLQCTTEDLAVECPISLRSAKRDIRYLDASELEGLRGRLVGTRLAAWRYEGARDDGREHYGFILDDDPTLPAADMDRGVVDLYTWATMNAAALQVQEKRIAELERQIAELKR